MRLATRAVFVDLSIRFMPHPDNFLGVGCLRQLPYFTLNLKRITSFIRDCFFVRAFCLNLPEVREKEWGFCQQ